VDNTLFLYNMDFNLLFQFELNSIKFTNPARGNV